MRDRIEELLVEEATDALTADRRAELESLLTEEPGCDRYAFERTVAAVFLAAGATGTQVLPAKLKSRITNDAKDVLAPQS